MSGTSIIAKIFVPLTNSVDADQTAPVEAVRSESTLSAFIFMLSNKQTLLDVFILLVF